MQVKYKRRGFNFNFRSAELPYFTPPHFLFNNTVKSNYISVFNLAFCFVNLPGYFLIQTVVEVAVYVIATRVKGKVRDDCVTAYESEPVFTCCFIFSFP